MVDELQTKKYNLIQRELGGIPLDWGGDLKVNKALEITVETIEQKRKENKNYYNKKYLADLLDYIFRADGPHSALPRKDRDRAKQILMEHYRIIE